MISSGLEALAVALLFVLGSWLLVCRARAIPLSERYRRVEWYASEGEKLG